MAVRVKVLFQAEKDSNFEREVELPSVTTVLGFKEHLEEKFNVPVCMQTLHHASATLRDDTSIASLRLRNGDKFVLSYYAAAECEETRRVIKWLETLASSFREGEVPYVDFGSDEQRILGTELFFPYQKPTKIANKQLFVANGGLGVLMQVYGNLTKCNWESMSGESRFLESNVLSALLPLSNTLAYQPAILKEGGVKMCLTSLLRVPIYSDKPVRDISAPKDQQIIFNLLLQESIKLALGVLAQ